MTAEASQGQKAMGAGMVARGELSGLTAAQALAITGGATAIDLAALKDRTTRSS